MALLYGPDSSKIISEHLKLPLTPHSGGGMRMHENLQYSNTVCVARGRVGDERHTQELQHWFGLLSVAEQESALSVQSPFLISLLLQLYSKRLAEGELEVTPKDQTKSEGAPSLLNFFTIKKRSQIPVDCDEFLRLTDTNEYLDTLTVDWRLLSEPGKFWAFMKEVSKNAAFTVPCREVKIAPKRTIYEYPPWIYPAANSYRSLLEWACAAFEQALWISYWTRHKPKTTGYAAVRQQVLTFWQSLSFDRRLEFLQKVKENARELLVQRLIPTPRVKVNKGFLKQVLYSKEKRGNLNFKKKEAIAYQEEGILDLFYLKAHDFEEFVHMLGYASFTRAYSLFDLSARQVLKKVLQAAEIHALDSLLTEVHLETALPVKKAKKKPKAVSQQPRAEERPVIKNNNTIELPRVETVNDSEDFKVVEKKKREKRPPPSPRRYTPSIEEQPILKAPIVHVPRVPNPRVVPSVNSTPRFVPLEENFPPLRAFSALHIEIENFVSQVAQKRTKKLAVIENVIKTLTKMIDPVHLGSELVMFGSYASGLALESSDVDLQLLNAKFNNPFIIQRVCIDVGNLLQSFSYVSNVKKIPKAKVPVVKFVVNLSAFEPFKQGSINVDMSFGSKTGSHSGLRTLQLTQDYLERFPPLKYVMIVVKTMLHVHNLNNAYLGGINSYSLLLWIVAFLKNKQKDYTDFGHCLLDLFHFYGSEFDFRNLAIDPKTQNGFSSKAGNEYATTIDPIDPNNDTTRTGYRIHNVIEAFANAYVRCTENELSDLNFCLIAKK